MMWQEALKAEREKIVPNVAQYGQKLPITARIMARGFVL